MSDQATAITPESIRRAVEKLRSAHGLEFPKPVFVVPECMVEPMREMFGLSVDVIAQRELLIDAPSRTFK